MAQTSDAFGYDAMVALHTELEETVGATIDGILAKHGLKRQSAGADNPKKTSFVWRIVDALRLCPSCNAAARVLVSDSVCPHCGDVAPSRDEYLDQLDLGDATPETLDAEAWDIVSQLDGEQWDDCRSGPGGTCERHFTTDNGACVVAWATELRHRREAMARNFQEGSVPS